MKVQEDDPAFYSINIYSSICQILMIFSIFMKYNEYFKWGVIVERIAFFESFFEAFQFKKLLVELIICIISPNYLFEGYIYKEYNQDYNYTINYRINDILLCFSFCRLYLIINACMFLTIFMEPRADRLCQQMGMYSDTWFAFKCFNKHRPFFTMNMSLTVTTLIFGY